LRHKPALVAAAVAAALCLALGSCGEDEADGADAANPVGPYRAGSVASLADCADWNGGGEPEKLATIDDIQAQVNQAGADGPTPDLPDDEAVDVLDGICANDYAVGFRLYKIYVRAAGFAPLAP
jgi:hypothetical protein